MIRDKHLGSHALVLALAAALLAYAIACYPGKLVEAVVGGTLLLARDSALTFEVALDPSSWTKAGDGVTFNIEIMHDTEASASTRHKPTILWSTYIDPKQNPENQRWHTLGVDLTAHTGEQVTLILEPGPGPAGDDRYDWAGWGTPQLIVTGPDS